MKEQERNLVKAIFLDRDGVINIDYGHVHEIENFKFIDGIFNLCRFFLSKGYIIIVVTNQGGIGKGLYSKNEFNDLDSWMRKEFYYEGIEISKTFYCPHTKEQNCECRKPKPGMFLRAIDDYKVDPKTSILIGDNMSDLEAGKQAGIENLFLFTENNHFELLDRIISTINFYYGD
jgi:D-glycero-D-manno-heptose 1,7-bisphosphate phosphatase